MKSLFLTALLFFSSTAALKADVPALPAPEAAAIAQADLVTRGLDSTIFLAQMTYKKESALNGAAYWEIVWSKSFPAQTKGRNEYGINITMDRNYTRSVK